LDILARSAKVCTGLKQFQAQGNDALGGEHRLIRQARRFAPVKPPAGPAQAAVGTSGSDAQPAITTRAPSGRRYSKLRVSFTRIGRAHARISPDSGVAAIFCMFTRRLSQRVQRFSQAQDLVGAESKDSTTF
jgi:hypothetical protein